jgi:hypothetical protein
MPTLEERNKATVRNFKHLVWAPVHLSRSWAA